MSRRYRGQLIKGSQTVGSVRWCATFAGVAVLDPATRLLMTPAAIRVYLGIAQAWQMSFAEQMTLLALPRPVWSQCIRGRRVALPGATLKRIAFVARIFESINVLLPPERADAWMRSPNAAPDFAGRSALACMLDDGRRGIALTRLYLRGQIYG